MAGADERTKAVDQWLQSALLGDDPALDNALKRNTEAGLPAIDVSPLQGRLLEMLARLTNARRILEIGALGGYSTISLARGAGPDGKVITMEREQHHADIARLNLDSAGVGNQVDIRVGEALASLDALIAADEAPFDLVFVDADKANNANYLERALRLSRPGTLLIFDNVVRGGRVIDFENRDAALEGIRQLVVDAGKLPLRATAIQTVGDKGWDGLLLAIVEGAEN